MNLLEIILYVVKMGRGLGNCLNVGLKKVIFDNSIFMLLSFSHV